MLELIDLDFDYHYEPILKNLSFRLSAGELLHLKGANGAGKTTLLRLIAGLHQPASGQILFQGESIENTLQNYHQHLCFIGHKTGISPNLTLAENCIYDVHYEMSEKNPTELAAIFNLEHHIDYPCGLLSAGQRRQVGLLRLWMTKAKLWLLDEPFVALDDNAQEILMSQIKSHRTRGGVVILTSHQSLLLHPDEYREYQL